MYPSFLENLTADLSGAHIGSKGGVNETKDGEEIEERHNLTLAGSPPLVRPLLR